MMNVSDSIRKNIVVGFVLLVIVGLIVATIMGKKQDEAFQLDDLYYNEVVKLLGEEKFAEALEVSGHLEKSQKSSELVNYVIAIAAANSEEVDKSIQHMQRTLDINPHRVENSTFMIQYAEILVFAEKKEEALEVLNRCATLPIPENYPDYQNRVAELQQQIATQL